MVAIVDLLRRWQSKQWSAQRLQQYLLPWLLVAPYGTLLIAWLLQRKCLLWSTPPGTKSDTTTHTPDSSSLPDWCFSASFLIPEQDNCWDYFYCHPGWPAVWTRVAGVLHRHYFAYPKPAPALHGELDLTKSLRPPTSNACATVHATWSSIYASTTASRSYHRDTTYALSPGSLPTCRPSRRCTAFRRTGEQTKSNRSLN